MNGSKGLDYIKFMFIIICPQQDSFPPSPIFFASSEDGSQGMLALSLYFQLLVELYKMQIAVIYLCKKEEFKDDVHLDACF
jgi:hypothetical protein